MKNEKTHESTSVDHHLAWINSARQEAALHRNRASAGRNLASSAVASESIIRDMLAEALPAYDIGETICRGGQGLIIKAVQRATRREVAIKALRAGHLASDHERTRLAREARILAQLKHSHIVTVHESGVAAGLHYFVMDFIPGGQLDDTVRKRALTVRQRLELFAKICEAVGVAHLRGIIHRDLKPGNVRVDPAGEPHILDFGLAKVDSHDMFSSSSDGAITMAGQFVGSLPWAAPEQFAGKPESIDLRTDVYSLGVMLYQLLTGHFPYDVTGSFTEAVRIICNVDPTRPSERCGGLDDEVDQIVLKCLRKEPAARYESANDLAREIRRYLAGEPIEAKRDSGWYVFRKSIRRHRVTATVATLVLLLIVSVAISLAVLYQREKQSARLERELRVKAQEAEQRAATALAEAQRQARIKEAVNHFFSGEVFAAAAPERLGAAATISQAMDAAAPLIDDRFADDPLVAGEIHLVLGATYFRQGRNDESVRHYEAAERLITTVLGDDNDATLSVRFGIARLYENVGRFEDSERFYKDCLDRRRRLLGENHVETLAAESGLGWLHARMGNWKEAESLCRHAMESLRRQIGDDHEETMGAMNNLGMILLETGRVEEAAPIMKAEMEASTRVFGEDHPGTLVSMGNLSQLYVQLGRHEDAIALAEKCLAVRRRVLSDDHPSTVLQINNLAMMFAKQGSDDRAETLLTEAYRRSQSALGRDHPTTISVTSNLAALRDRLGRHAEAEPLHREALDRAKSYLPANHAYIGLYLSRLGRCLLQLDRANEAEPLLREGLAILDQSPGEEQNARETSEALEEAVRLHRDIE